MFHSNHADIIQANTWNGYAFKKNIPLFVTEYHVIHDPLQDFLKKSWENVGRQFIDAYDLISKNDL
jgi:hypothetical protein